MCPLYCVDFHSRKCDTKYSKIIKAFEFNIFIKLLNESTIQFYRTLKSQCLLPLLFIIYLRTIFNSTSTPSFLSFHLHASTFAIKNYRNVNATLEYFLAFNNRMCPTGCCGRRSLSYKI